jgi:uncharacterized UBP type Zn finger protein
MRPHIVRVVALVTLGLLVACLGTACGPKAKVDEKTQQTAHSLPGAAEVLASLEQKNYDAAMAGLMKIKMALASEEDTTAYSVLAWEVKAKLQEAAPTDPKAAEALHNLRSMATGR